LQTKIPKTNPIRNNSNEESGEQSSDSKEESYLEIVTEESYEEKIFSKKYDILDKEYSFTEKN
jgi:hypothetical protein